MSETITGVRTVAVPVTDEDRSERETSGVVSGGSPPAPGRSCPAPPWR